MSRAKDWEGRLHGFLESCAVESFQWGKWDCGIMAARAVDGLTGTSFANDLVGTYDEETAPVRLDLIADKMLGRHNRIKHKMARRGDVHLVRVGNQHTFCVDYGDSAIFCSTRGAKVMGKGVVDKFLVTWRI